MITRCVPVLVLAAFGASACGEATPAAPLVAADPVAATLAKAPTSVPVVTMAGVEVGTSQLTRTRAGVSLRVSTTGLEPGTATTVWIAIFNQPENCAGSPCAEPDLFNAAAQPDLLYLAGHVVGGSGMATFAGRRNVGDSAGSLFPLLFGMPSVGLLDPMNAEIHVIVRGHGPVIPGRVREMTSTVFGACNDAPPGVPEVGLPGPNTCADLQMAIHQP